MGTLRKIPPVCLLISLVRLLTGRLVFSDQYLGLSVRNNQSGGYTIFRHVQIHPLKEGQESCVFTVCFKFSRLSLRANKVASVIPMLLITGFPGFIQKVYSVDHHSDYWQGMYQWRSQPELEAYQRSFVFRMMNRRAIKGSVTSMTFPDMNLKEYLQKYIPEIDKEQVNKPSKTIKPPLL